MPLGKTPILQNDLMAEGDNQKYLLFNDALVALEDADNRKRAVDLTDADYTLLESEILRYALFKCTGHTVARILTVPATVGDGTYACNRKFAVRNDGTEAITVTNGGTGNEVTIAAGTTGLLHTDGTDVISLGGVSNAAATTVADDNATVVTTLTALKFSGTEFTVTDDGGGQATITVAVPKSLGDLDDIAAYTDNAGKILKVNDTEDGTEWVPLPANTLEGLSNVDALANNAGKILAVKDTEDGGEWIDLPSGSLQALSDVDVPGITDGQGIVYDSATGKFVTYDLPPTLTAAEIKTLYESNSNTNVFTSSEKQKLAAITASFFAGTYTDQAALEAAVTSPVAGNFAFLDAGAGSDPVMVIWDDNDAQWATASAAAMTGADIVSAINTTLGNTDWQNGGTALPAYTSNASKHLAVNATEDGLEWVDPPTGGGGVAYPDFTANASKHLAVNATEDGVEWVDPPSGGAGGGTYKNDWKNLSGIDFEDGSMDRLLTLSGDSVPTVESQVNSTFGTTKVLLIDGVPDNGSTSLSFEVDTAAVDSIAINYKVSSESGYDKFYVRSDQEGVSDPLTLLTDSGTTGGNETLTVSTDTLDPGVRTITLIYAKDGSGKSGDDAVWLFNIVFTPAPGMDYSLGDTVTFDGATYLSKIDQNLSRPYSTDWAKMSALPAVAANAGKVLAVTATEDGTEWIDPPSGSASYPDFSGNTGKVLKVNAAEDGVEWAVDEAGSGGATLPALTGNAGKLLAVNPTEDAALWTSVVDVQGKSAQNWAVPFRGATAILNPQPLDVSSSVTVAWSNVTEDTDNFWDGATPSVFTVPAGVTKVRLHAHFNVDSGSVGGSIYAAFIKNGTTAFNGNGRLGTSTGYSNQVSSLVSGAIDVVAGDTLACVIQISGGTQFTTLTGTSFQIEVVEMSDAVTRPLDLHAYCPGVPSASAVISQALLSRAASLKAGMVGAIGLSGTAATTSTVFSVTKNGTSIGTITFAAGATTPTFALAADAKFVRGDVLAIVAPASPDATLADINVTLQLIYME